MAPPRAGKRKRPASRGRGYQRSRSDQTRRLDARTPPVEVTIGHVGARGDGIGEAEVTLDYETRTRSIFVPFTLAGERVVAKLLEERGEGISAEPLELLSESADRSDPPCPHFMTCGGCALQHMNETAYRAWKLDLVRQHLSRVDLQPDLVEDLQGTRPGTRRRADLVAQVLKGRAVIGFHERASNRVIDLEACPVLLPEIVELITELRSLLSDWLAAGSRADVVINALDEGLDLALVIPSEPSLDMHEAMAGLVERLALCRMSYRLSDDPPFAWRPVAERRAATVTVPGGKLLPPPGSFLQATAESEAMIIEEVRAIARDAKRVADLYAGCGTLTLPLAADGTRQVHAVEGSAAMTKALYDAARTSGLGERVSRESRDLSNQPLEGKELESFEAIVLDPPRAGARAQSHALARSPVARIAYVSCNPATFARDARILVDGGYVLKSVKPIDQFLWSPHLELVGHFERENT